MNRIRLLPDHVANQIAAGEVVERPASVVKELVENSLDAGAARITVEVQAGGRSLIRVTDDGTGMSRDDALLCLERHATSKIQRAEDLSAISTMGFRGEAMPSIASVCRFTLTTRERESTSPEGTEIIIAGGKITEVKAAGCATGTVVEVRQLFFNLPARRKFLRTEETEFAHIQHYVTLAALAFPEVAFTLIKDGRTVWQLPGVKSCDTAEARMAGLRERLRALLGGEDRLLPVDHSGDLAVVEENEVESASEAVFETPPVISQSRMRVWGFVGAPGVARATREDQHLFVNRRPVDNRGLNHALIEGYHTSLMKGRFPLCCLFVEINPALVDVNIHPSKREVKFHRESDVRRIVAHAVKQTLLTFHTQRAQSGSGMPPVGATPVARAPESTQHATPINREQARSTPAEPTLPKFELSQPAANAPVPQRIVQRPAYESPARPASAPEVSPEPVRPPFPTQHATPINREQARNTPPEPSTTRTVTSNAPVPLLQVPLRLVGVIGKLYVVLESDRGLVLLDQHAAHERILFEQMLARVEQGGQAPSQRLLLPETLELSIRDTTFLREQLSVLTQLGVGLSEFGERTFLLDALPPFVKVSDARRFALELVDELQAAGAGVNSARLGEHVVAKTVCRHAVKANDPLQGRELQNLVEDLRRCAMPYTCPHGRPTLIEMGWRELERKFGRTQ